MLLILSGLLSLNYYYKISFSCGRCGGATITLCDSCMYSYFYQTDAQFERCLDQLFSVQLSPVEAQILLSKYGSNPQQRGMVCYRDFCAAIDAS
jgi:hypothetical protein